MHLGGGLEVRGILQSDLFAKTVECGTAGPCVLSLYPCSHCMKHDQASEASSTPACRRESQCDFEKCMCMLDFVTSHAFRAGATCRTAEAHCT